MRWLALTIVTFGLALPAAAADSAAPEFKEVSRTARVTYFAPKKLSIDVKRTEAFLDRLTTLFGAMPDGWRLRYYRHASPYVVHPVLGAWAYGFTDLDAVRIDSVRGYHPHELVHAVTGRLGRPPLVFVEGLAVALTAEGKWGGADMDAIAREAMRENRSLEPFLSRFTEQRPDTAYAVAGSWVAFLLETQGVDAFVAFMKGCSGDHGRFEAAFQRAYGRTMTRAAEAWRRSLSEGVRITRRWYAPSSWPRSLQRERLTGDAPGSVTLTQRAAVEAVATDRAVAVAFDFTPAGLLESPNAR